MLLYDLVGSGRRVARVGRVIAPTLQHSTRLYFFPVIVVCRSPLIVTVQTVQLSPI